jgi:hypothetical protein
MFPGEQASQPFSDVVDGVAEQGAVRPGEVDMLEDAVCTVLSQFYG